MIFITIVALFDSNNETVFYFISFLLLPSPSASSFVCIQAKKKPPKCLLLPFHLFQSRTNLWILNFLFFFILFAHESNDHQEYNVLKERKKKLRKHKNTVHTAQPFSVSNVNCKYENILLT